MTTHTNKQLITDSAWFWVLVFSVAGLALLNVLVVSGQYRQAAGAAGAAVSGPRAVIENAVDDPARREYATPDSTLVPIWPLAVVLGGAILSRRRCCGAQLESAG